jgi:ubiquitin-protein ligase E3 C
MFDPSLSSGRNNRVNLSTGGASSSSSLLENVRAERLLREERIKQERAAVLIQRRWRGRREGDKVRRELLSQLDELVTSDVISSAEVERRARALVIMNRWKGSVEMTGRVDRLLMGLVRSGREVDTGKPKPILYRAELMPLQIMVDCAS